MDQRQLRGCGMARIAIYGIGGFGRELIAPLSALIASEEQAGRKRRDLCFVDDAKDSGMICGIPVLSFDRLRSGDEYVVAVGSGKTRHAIEAKCEAAGLLPLSLFAKSYEQGPDVEIGPGAVFCGQTIVTASAKIGRQFQANIYSYIAHDCIIGDYVTFAPRVCCNGNVHIDDFAYIGTGAIIKQGANDKPLRIGRGAIVGMGAVVTKDIAPGAVVVGNPARSRE